MCKYHFGSKGMTWNQTGSLSQQMNDSSLSVTWALILTIYLICLSVSLSPSFFQSAALWCTSVAMNSSPSPAPEQIRVLHQMWVQICLPFPSFLHSPAFCLPFSLSLSLQSVSVSLSIPCETTEKRGGQKLLFSGKSNQTYCHRGSVWDSWGDDNPLLSDFLLESSLLILSRAPELYNHLNQRITRSVVTATGSASTWGTRALFCYCAWELT